MARWTQEIRCLYLHRHENRKIQLDSVYQLKMDINLQTTNLLRPANGDYVWYGWTVKGNEPCHGEAALFSIWISRWANSY
ncbi:hypothetical protein OUZ56_008297 [Daphnia magna]|uniref:Uncharacterized protein n=1 Tax=Daphnia magna TaxID=35525 RepID=A0ABR0ACP7_9CRUS|nr:hypothetical protein OUZ56_008297 [Daphnia magna]